MKGIVFTMYEGGCAFANLELMLVIIEQGVWTLYLVFDIDPINIVGIHRQPGSDVFRREASVRLF